MEINESEEEEDEDFRNYYSSTFFDAHPDRLQEGQACHHTAQVRAHSFTLQGWKSDDSYLTSVGFDSDSKPSKNCNEQEKATSTMRQVSIGRASEAETSYGFSLRPATSSASLHPRP
jgi:hypothetical protein